MEKINKLRYIPRESMDDFFNKYFTMKIMINSNNLLKVFIEKIL